MTDDTFELFGPDMLADPYATYATLRALDPVHWSSALASWVLTRFDDVSAALRNPDFSSNLPTSRPDAVADGASGAAPQVLAQTYTFVSSSLVFSDAPAHTRLRRLVSRAFAPGVIEELSTVIASTAQRLLDSDTAEVDIVGDLAEPLPMAILAELLGVSLSDEDGRRVKEACDDFLLPFGRDLATLTGEELGRAQAAGRQLQEFVTAVLDRTGGREDDVVGRLLAGEVDDRLSRDELFANIVLLLVAGHENLTSLLGNGTALLLELPDVRRSLAADPSRWPAVIDELLRLVTPNQFIRRQASVDVRVGDRLIRAGDSVLLVLAGANRDPDRYPEPDRFRLDRPDRRDLSMGLGPHYCLGAPLARLEARIALQTLLDRFPEVRRVPTDLTYVPNFNVRLLQALPVVLR